MYIADKLLHDLGWTQPLGEHIDTFIKSLNIPNEDTRNVMYFDNNKQIVYIKANSDVCSLPYSAELTAADLYAINLRCVEMGWGNELQA